MSSNANQDVMADCQVTPDVFMYDVSAKRYRAVNLWFALIVLSSVFHLAGMGT